MGHVFGDVISAIHWSWAQCRKYAAAGALLFCVSSCRRGVQFLPVLDPSCATSNSQNTRSFLVAPSQNFTIMSTSRNAYTALTPDYADFSIPHTVGAPSDPAGRDPSGYEDDFEEERQSRWCAALGKAKATVKNNVGLLLVAASQAFFSMMNVAVKKLNSIDPPVETLQVCWL
jgi:hypothetical protein